MKIIDIETTGLQAIKDRILCISLLDVEKNALKSFYGDSEAQILEGFWSEIGNGEEIVTFNGDSFDIPFLIKRSVINNTKLKKNIVSIDLRKIVNGFFFSYNKYEKGNLREWAEVFDIEVNTDNGDKMLQLFIDKDWEAIKKHGEEDVKITKLLYDRCKGVGLI